MADDNTLTVGYRLERYRIVRVLGSGSFGNVYLCDDGRGGEVVLREYMPRGLAVRAADGAVQPQQAAEAVFAAGLAGFVERAERLAAVAHPNIVRIHRVFPGKGTAYVAMDHVPGTSLEASLGPGGTLSPDALAAVLLPVLDGLRTIHRDGLAHGNIGPGSIVSRDDGTPVLLGVAVPPRDEFGVVARPNYAPIERYSTEGALADQRTDVYAVGAVMYRCVTGVAPPEAPLRAERDTLAPATRAAGRRSGYGNALTAAIDAALAVQPQDRPATLDGLRDALAGAERPKDAAGPALAERREDADERESAGESQETAGPRGRFATVAAKAPRGRAAAFALAAVAGMLVAGTALWRLGDGPGPTADAPPPAAQPTPAAVAPPVEPPASNPVGARPDADDPRPAPPPAIGDVAEPDPGPVADADAPAPADDGSAVLVVETAPPGARVLLDGDEIGVTPLFTAMPAGEHAVTLQHPLFNTVELSAQRLAPGEELRIDRELVRATGALRVVGAPADAWIDHEGRRMAEGLPATLEGLPTGPAVLDAGADGHVPATVTAEVERDATVTVELHLERLLGTLTLVLEPPGADVVLAGVEDPYVQGMELAHGTHTVEVASAGYRSASRTFEVAGATTVAVSLEPVPQPLTILTEPRGADVAFVDAPFSYRDGVVVPPGEYALRAVLRGYAPWSGTVEHGVAPTVHPVSLEFVSAQYADPLDAGGEGPAMAVVPAGSFEAACGDEAACPPPGDPGRQVVFAAPFALSIHEVTFRDYERFADATERPRPADGGWGRGRRPVINVSWRDATAYAAWLSAQTGRPYRLPTEAEWEYAARAGTTTAYPWGDAAGSGRANCDGCGPRSPGRTLPAGSFDANAWGLHDMHGNVWEWVGDCWSPRTAGAASAAPPPARADCRRVLRGGSWFNAPAFARSASRLSGDADVLGTIAGFRVASDLVAQPAARR